MSIIIKVGPVRSQPPFLNDTIELLVTAPDCAEYNFEVKMYAAGSKEIGKVGKQQLEVDNCNIHCDNVSL